MELTVHVIHGHEVVPRSGVLRAGDAAFARIAADEVVVAVGGHRFGRHFAAAGI